MKFSLIIFTNFTNAFIKTENVKQIYARMRFCPAQGSQGLEELMDLLTNTNDLNNTELSKAKVLTVCK